MLTPLFEDRSVTWGLSHCWYCQYSRLLRREVDWQLSAETAGGQRYKISPKITRRIASGRDPAA
jgi:hypothetical protein